MQSLLSRERFQPSENVDMCENRLIKGLLCQAIEVPLVEISVQSDQGDGTFLCGLIDTLSHGVHVLIGSDREDLVPIHDGVVTSGLRVQHLSYPTRTRIP